MCRIGLRCTILKTHCSDSGKFEVVFKNLLCSLLMDNVNVMIHYYDHLIFELS